MVKSTTKTTKHVSKKDTSNEIPLKTKLIIAISTLVVLVFFFFFTKSLSVTSLNDLGLMMPLPLFTLLIGLVDGFNPCNLFVLTMLLSMMLAESHSRKKIFTVGFTFIAVIYVFYFLFMAAWLNIIKYIGFVTPLRIIIAVVAIVAGLINAKEFFFYRKGITLMVQDRHVGPLRRRVQGVAHLMKKGSLPILMLSAAMLAVFASLVELPCTAGFPIIYTGILSGMGFETGFFHYAYLALYNLFYILPLLVIISVFGFTFNGKQISKETMSLIKFIGGAIMLLLGIILLSNPALIGLG